MTELSILHFNDVYRVNPQKLSGGGTVDVTQFAFMLDEIRNSWSERGDGKRDGLVLFSGDLFSPSVESSVTRGSHMVPLMNEIAPDVSVAGNHDFDFGYPHLTKLLKDTKFPWLLSNIVDTTTSKVPEGLREYLVLERRGVRVGIIGLVEKDWIATVSSWPTEFKYKDMAEVAIDLSKRLRDPAGEHRCDLIIALTHCRIPNDISLAKAINALAPSAQSESFANMHGVDILLGGHDHLYYASKGVGSWEGYDINKKALGAEHDNGEVLVVKSGTDFRDLTEISLELADIPEGNVRRRVIKNIKGTRHSTKPDSNSSQSVKAILSKILESVSGTMKAPVCKTVVPLNCRSELLRTGESASGDWFADVLLHAFDDALCVMGRGGADAVFICAGTLRGDSVYGPGNVTLGDILEILPFEDPVVVLELDGKTIWEAFEAALSKYPAQEGRFPVTSGFRVTWDSRKPPNQRVQSIALQLKKTAEEHNGGDSTPKTVDFEEVKREEGSRKYLVVTREYIAAGHDGFDCLVGSKYLIDDEVGQVMSTIVRKYLLGAKFIKKMTRPSVQATNLLHSETAKMLDHAKARTARLDRAASERARGRWKHAIEEVRMVAHSPTEYQAPLSIAMREHMTGVDCFDGERARAGDEGGGSNPEGHAEDEDLLEITPTVDGRLKDIGRS